MPMSHAAHVVTLGTHSAMAAILMTTRLIKRMTRYLLVVRTLTHADFRCSGARIYIARIPNVGYTRTGASLGKDGVHISRTCHARDVTTSQLKKLWTTDVADPATRVVVHIVAVTTQRIQTTHITRAYCVSMSRMRMRHAMDAMDLVITLQSHVMQDAMTRLRTLWMILTIPTIVFSLG